MACGDCDYYRGSKDVCEACGELLHEPAIVVDGDNETLFEGTERSARMFLAANDRGDMKLLKV